MAEKSDKHGREVRIGDAIDKLLASLGSAIDHHEASM